MKNTLYIIPSLLIIFSFIFFTGCSKKILLDKTADIEKAVHDELNASATNGTIANFVKLKNIKGEYVFDFTVYKDGKVLTITPVSNENGSVQSQNLLKDYFKEFIFNFRLKADQKVKVRNTFKF
ncbi:MAG: hypothetical protein HY958_08255 [Bacteroidia bacterium]|nr:hypothetical protein [Bacteroidia bacterium]